MRWLGGPLMPDQPDYPEVIPEGGPPDPNAPPDIPWPSPDSGLAPPTGPTPGPEPYVPLDQRYAAYASPPPEPEVGGSPPEMASPPAPPMPTVMPGTFSNPGTPAAAPFHTQSFGVNRFTGGAPQRFGPGSPFSGGGMSMSGDDEKKKRLEELFKSLASGM